MAPKPAGTLKNHFILVYCHSKTHICYWNVYFGPTRAINKSNLSTILAIVNGFSACDIKQNKTSRSLRRKL